MSRNQQEDKAKLLAQLHKTPIVQVACERTGIPRSTYYRWHKDDEAFSESCDTAITESTGLINDMAESQLISAIKDKNLTAIIFWLKHHHGTYATRVQVDATHRLLDERLNPEQQLLLERALELSGLSEPADG